MRQLFTDRQRTRIYWIAFTLTQWLCIYNSCRINSMTKRVEHLEQAATKAHTDSINTIHYHTDSIKRAFYHKQLTH